MKKYQIKEVYMADILHLNYSLMVFQDNSAKDHRLSKESHSSKLFYLVSSDVIGYVTYILKNKLI